MRVLLAEWSETGKKEQLIKIIAQHLEPPAPTLENRSSEAELLQEARNQVEALMNWFTLGKNADSFRRNALAEVDKVVRRASVLAASARPNANYTTNLNWLAHQFFQAIFHIGLIRQPSAEERDALLTVIDSCLGDARRQYQAPDGSLIVLLNPDEQTYTALRSPDGVLLLPRYCLVREDAKGRSA